MAADERTHPLVLIVEDDDDISESLASLLNAEEFEVAIASDGVNAIEQARKRPPDVILLDLMLPRLDGMGVAAELRRDSALRQVPLILFSAGRQLDQAAREAGTPYYLRKPFDLDEIVAMIRRALASPRAAEPAPPAGPRSGTGSGG